MRGSQALVELAAQQAIRRAKAEAKALRRELNLAHKALVAERKRSGVLEDLRASAVKPVVVRPRKACGKRVATAVLLCSDWHVGERVTAAKVNGVNAYNVAEAEHRARRLADAFTWLIEHHRNNFDITEAVIWLGGDLITGYLHPDQQQSNTLPPNKEVLLVQDLVHNLLDQTLALPGMERVVVPCSYGNHGRTTVKPQIATGAENSFEWLLYHQLRRSYAGESRVQWQIADGEQTYLKVYDTWLRFTHGDATKYQGGVGGLTIPVNKAIARWQTYRHADITCMGHYHQYLDMPGLVVNGSLIGAAPYGMRVGQFEAPVQSFFLIDRKRGKAQSTPVWVTGR